MAKKQNKKQRQREPQAGSTTPPLPGKAEPQKPAHPPLPGHSILREIFESLAVAIMLALFIRTFVAEPFVIPTGSMAPTLMGAHKDVICPICGERFKVNASTDSAQSDKQRADMQCLAGMCSVCRYTVPFNRHLAELPSAPETIAPTPTYSGDRIVVNKYIYSFRDPERWDVVVFKFPGSASDNYIKRLVGLPNETIGIYQGDLFVGGNEATRIADMRIASKPPSTALAMRHVVHDTYREPAALYDRGWPVRWASDPAAAGWTVTDERKGSNLVQRFRSSETGEHWLRYRHFVPTQQDWQALERGESPTPRAKLIDDFQSYNSSVTQGGINHNLHNETQDPFYIPAVSQGIHWVGDLMVEADLTTTRNEGAILLEVVESGHRFRSVIDLANGTARLEVLPWGADEAISLAEGGKTSLNKSGKHHLILANVDDALHLWVDGQIVEFDSSPVYDWAKLFGERNDKLPRTSGSNPGDLAPAGIASRDASISVERLQVWRDTYYLAVRDMLRGYDPKVPQPWGVLVDYQDWPEDDLLYDPRLWHKFALRRPEFFSLGKDQFFVLGDNSPASQDARLWHTEGSVTGLINNPGGNYLERRLLIGRAVGVVWPHTWDYVIPGFSDMRLIR